MVKLLDLPRGTELALVVLALCAGAPLLSKKLIKLGGDPSYVYSLVIATSLLAIVTVPLSLRVLGTVIPFGDDITASEVAGTILKTFLIPLVAGMILRLLLPAIAERASDLLLKAAGIAFSICALVVLVGGWRLFLGLGWSSYLAFAAFTASMILCGHLLGGPEPSGRTSLAMATASRHIGLAMLIAASVRGPRTLTLVAGYLLASGLVGLVYIRLRSGTAPKAAV
jgi:BASS family bile acid:Na+ symporter